MLLHDTTFEMEFATFEAREASFAPPSKRSKTGGWPHKTPKPADLAKAGFYFKPSAQSNDNAVCFMCNRNLDGWEKDDDPIEEHLKHAEDCGWALTMSLEVQKHSNPSEMDDPTEVRIAEARRSTFAAGWPHESKRAWTCKIEKMVEAGWYFAPTSESEDYVSCAYCKLSLDGWEPKDNPFEEHYSRSPECPFFIFAGTTAPSKRPKAKKARASRTSRTSRASTRLSTQSNLTMQTEITEIPDLEESIDTSNISLTSTTSTATTKGKGKRKAAGSRAKAAKTKKAKTTKSKKKEKTPEPEPELEPELEEQTTQEEQIPQSSPVNHSVIEPEPEKPKVRSKRTKTKKVEEERPPVTEAPLSPVGSLGPPEREASVIPVLPSSPVPAVSTDPQEKQTSTLSPQITATANKQTTSEQPTPPPPSPPNSASDVENAPPSSRPKAVRPPLSSPGATTPTWTSVDVEMIFGSAGPASLLQSRALPEAEQQMTVQDWVKFIATRAEDDLRNEGERVVGIFEKEGQRAIRVLEGIVCT